MSSYIRDPSLRTPDSEIGSERSDRNEPNERASIGNERPSNNARFSAVQGYTVLTPVRPEAMVHAGQRSMAYPILRAHLSAHPLPHARYLPCRLMPVPRATDYLRFSNTAIPGQSRQQFIRVPYHFTSNHAQRPYDVPAPNPLPWHFRCPCRICQHDISFFQSVEGQVPLQRHDPQVGRPISSYENNSPIGSIRRPSSCIFTPSSEIRAQRPWVGRPTLSHWTGPTPGSVNEEHISSSHRLLAQGQHDAPNTCRPISHRTDSNVGSVNEEFNREEADLHAQRILDACSCSCSLCLRNRWRLTQQGQIPEQIRFPGCPCDTCQVRAYNTPHLGTGISRPLTSDVSRQIQFNVEVTIGLQHYSFSPENPATPPALVIISTNPRISWGTPGVAGRSGANEFIEEGFETSVISSEDAEASESVIQNNETSSRGQ